MADKMFARQIHRGLLNKGWTPAELARQSGLPRGYVRAIILGFSPPDEDREKLLMALAEEGEKVGTKRPSD